MAKPTDELTFELVTEELSAMAVPGQDLRGAQLDSLLSLVNVSSAKEAAEEIVDGSISKSQLVSLGADGTNGGSPFGPPVGVVVGKLVNVSPHGIAEVDFPGNASLKPLCARAAISLENTHSNQEVVLMFENGDFGKPVIMGVLQPQGDVSQHGVNTKSPRTQTPLSIQVDEERLTCTANKEIVLKCGKASITLTRAGKIIIRGTYLLSRSSGVNSIKGGSVQIN